MLAAVGSGEAGEVEPSPTGRAILRTVALKALVWVGVVAASLAVVSSVDSPSIKPLDVSEAFGIALWWSMPAAILLGVGCRGPFGWFGLGCLLLGGGFLLVDVFTEQSSTAGIGIAVVPPVLSVGAFAILIVEHFVEWITRQAGAGDEDS